MSHNPEEDPDKPDTWVPDDVIAGLAMERQMFAEETEETSVRKIFRLNAPAAAAAVVHIALHGSNERLRLDASKYVVERVIGRVGDDVYGETNPVDDFISSVIQYTEENA